MGGGGGSSVDSSEHYSVNTMTTHVNVYVLMYLLTYKLHESIMFLCITSTHQAQLPKQWLHGKWHSNCSHEEKERWDSLLRLLPEVYRPYIYQHKEHKRDFS